MKAESILELINESPLTPEEHKEYQFYMEWVKKHDGKVSVSTPVGKLALIAYLAEKEIREESVKTKLGASAVSVAKLVNGYQKTNNEGYRGAGVGTLYGEKYQLFMLSCAVMVALKEPNDLIEANADDGIGEKLANLFSRMDKGYFHNIVVRSDKIESAYKLSRTRGYNPGLRSPKRYPPITINGKLYDVGLVRDILRVLGTDHMVWKQETNNLHTDIIETDRGMALICPMRFDETINGVGCPLEPIKIED